MLVVNKEEDIIFLIIDEYKFYKKDKWIRWGLIIYLCNLIRIIIVYI